MKGLKGVGCAMALAVSLSGGIAAAEERLVLDAQSLDAVTAGAGLIAGALYLTTFNVQNSGAVNDSHSSNVVVFESIVNTGGVVTKTTSASAVQVGVSRAQAFNGSARGLVIAGSGLTGF